MAQVLMLREVQTEASATRIAQSLKLLLAEAEFIHDLGSFLLPGDDYVQIITDKVKQMAFVLVLIDKTWENSDSVKDPNSFSYLGLKVALENRHKILPVLLEGATMPRPEQLPTDLQAISRRAPLRLYEASWEDDLKKIAEELAKVLGLEVRMAQNQASAGRSPSQYQAQPVPPMPVGAMPVQPSKSSFDPTPNRNEGPRYDPNTGTPIFPVPYAPRGQAGPGGPTGNMTKANLAFAIEVVGPFFLVLGVGHIVAGNPMRGFGTMFAWWAYLVVSVIVSAITFGLLAPVFTFLGIILIVYSALQARQYALYGGS